MYNSYWYIIENEGVATDSDYPYRAMVGSLDQPPKITV